MLRYENATFSVSNPYRTVRSYSTPIYDVEGEKLIAATDTYFPDLKVMVLRDSEDQSEGMFFAMKGGHNNESHNHNDVGSFIVYKNGRPVIIDAGVGEYTKQTFSSERYKIWTMQSLYHNLPAFDGVGQVAGERYASKNEVYDKDNRSLSLELKDAYADECGVISYVRSGSLSEGLVTVKEHVQLAEEKLIDFVLLTHVMPKIEESGKVTLAEGTLLEYDTLLSAEIEPFDPAGLNAESAWGTSTLYRLHFKIKADKCDVTFTIH
jgi:hypothetical protein